MAWTTVHALTSPPASAFAAFGEGSVIVPPTRVDHPDCIHVGRGVIILEHSWLAVERRDGMPEPILRVGDDTRMNRFVKIECHGAVTLGRGVLVADQVYIGDSEVVPEANDAPRSMADVDVRPVVIGDRVFLGAGSIVKPGVTIGDGAYVSAGSIVTADVPERTLVLGAPARVIRQWEPTDD
jgi:acetyltransferase-like isoleucine patch superfamily enzyme